jgi:hypothetical protein
MVILAGVAGVGIAVLVNFTALLAPLPQLDKNNTLTLSAFEAAELLVKLTLITCEFAFPESILALAPSVPLNDHNQPVAAIVVDVATPVDNAGAAYLYTLFPQTLVVTGVMVIEAGAAGGAIKAFVNFVARAVLFPQLEV